DPDAIAHLYADGAEITVHELGVVMDRQEIAAWWHLFFSDRNPAFRLEPVATLGASLALHRRCWSGSASRDAVFDVGSFEREAFDLGEVDGETRLVRIDTFAPDRLGDAVALLYERYADLLPDGSAPARVAATARSVVALLGPPDRWPFAPDAEATDHRTVGFGSVRGGEAVLEAIRALLQLSDDFASRIDDVLALRSDALLVRWTTSGTVRVSGGAFERNCLMLWVFGADGLLTRWEQFDTAREDEALARFDELTADAPRTRGETVPSRAAKKSAHRVRPNAATANAARLHAAVASRDWDPLPALCADEIEVVDHTTGVVYDRTGYLATFRVLSKAEHPSFAPETLATLGDSLALYRESTSASGFVGRTFDVGAYEKEEIALVEVDAQGRHRRRDLFA